MDIFQLARENRHQEILALIEDTRIVDDDAVMLLINERDDRGRTALHIAATHGCNEAVVILLRSSADHALLDWESGWTALHRALYFGHFRAALLLIG